MHEPSESEQRNPSAVPSDDPQDQATATDASGNPHLGKRPLAILFLTVVIDLLGFGIVLPFLPVYAETLTTSPNDTVKGLLVGFLLASFSIMQFLASSSWGRLSDRIGRRPVLMIGLAGSVAAYTLFGVGCLLKSYWLMLISRIGAGLAGATVSITQAYIADVTSAQHRTKSLALIGLAFGIGFTFGPIIGIISLVTDPYAPAVKQLDLSAGEMSTVSSDTKATNKDASSTRSQPLESMKELAATNPQSLVRDSYLSPMPGFWAAALSLVAFLLSIYWLPESLHLRDHVHGKNESAVDEVRRTSTWASFQHALAQPRVLGWILIAAFTILAFSTYESTLARLAINAFHFSQTGKNWVFVACGLIFAIGQGVVVRRLATRISDRAMLGWGTAILLAGQLGLCASVITGTATGFLATLPMIAVGYAMVTTSTNALVSKESSVHEQGEMMGLTQSFGALSRIAGPLFGNSLFGVRHWLPYAASATLLILGAYWQMQKHRSNKSAE